MISDDDIKDYIAKGKTPKDFIKDKNITSPSDKRSVYRKFKKFAPKSEEPEEPNEEEVSKTSKVKSTSQIPEDTVVVKKEEEKPEAEALKEIYSQQSVPDFGNINEEILNKEEEAKAEENEEEATPEAQPIDVSGLANVVPTVLNAVFKKYNVPQLTDEERNKIIEKSSVVIEKRAPKIVTQYYDIIDLGIVVIPIVFDRINQAQDIYKRVKEEQEIIKKTEQAQQQPTESKTEEAVEKIVGRPTIDPNSPNYDPELAREWMDYGMGKGPRPSRPPW